MLQPNTRDTLNADYFRSLQKHTYPIYERFSCRHTAPLHWIIFKDLDYFTCNLSIKLSEDTPPLLN